MYEMDQMWVEMKTVWLETDSLKLTRSGAPKIVKMGVIVFICTSSVSEWGTRIEGRKVGSL